MPSNLTGFTLDDTGYSVQEYLNILASGGTSAPQDRPKYGGMVVSDAPRRRAAAVAPERTATPAPKKIGMSISTYDPELSRLLGDL